MDRWVVDKAVDSIVYEYFDGISLGESVNKFKKLIELVEHEQDNHLRGGYKNDNGEREASI